MAKQQNRGDYRRGRNRPAAQPHQLVSPAGAHLLKAREGDTVVLRGPEGDETSRFWKSNTWRWTERARRLMIICRRSESLSLERLTKPLLASLPDLAVLLVHCLRSCA